MENRKPDWIEKMDELFHLKTPFVGFISFDRNVGEIHTWEACLEENILFDFRGKSNFENRNSSPGIFSSAHFEPVSIAQYATQFDQVKQEIYHGNTYLLNLCSASPSHDDIDLLDVFHRSKAPYRLFFKDRFIVFSPETFITLSGHVIRTFPMKGTIDAELPDAQYRLRSDEKEIAEHYTIVDLLRNDLGSVCDRIHVDRFAYLDKILTSKGPIWQMSSEIRGELSSAFQRSPGSMFYNLLPAGSISGAPKQKTLEIIHEIEEFNRGYYTGVMIYFDGFQFDSAVMIRFIEKDEKGIHWYKSGGGITHKSDLQKEYEELIRKIYLPVF